MNRTRKQAPKLTAGQWELYDLPGADEAAAAINASLQEALNKGYTKEQAHDSVSLTLCNYSDLGAFDTEPRAILVAVLNKLF